jgi:membrane protein DedA with SNARE-associated domain
MDIAATLSLAGLLLIKEAGIPIPVPGDLLVIGAGVATAGNPAGGLFVLLAILAAGFIGGGLQYVAVRGALRDPLIRLLARFGVSPARIDALADRLRRGGARGVAVARATPGVRVPAIAASGIAGVPARSFAPGLVAGNTVFVSAHFALGFLVGLPAVALVQAAAPVLAVAAFIAFAALGAIGWVVVRRRRRGTQPRQTPADADYAAWSDASCPACVAVALFTPSTRVTS